MVLDRCPYSDVVALDGPTNVYFQMQQAEIGKITSTSGVVATSVRVAGLTTSNLPVGLTNTLSPTGVNPTILFTTSANSLDFTVERIEFFFDMSNATSGGITFFQAFRRRFESSPGQWLGDFFNIGFNNVGVVTTLVYENYDLGLGYSNFALGQNLNLQVGSNYVIVQREITNITIRVNNVLVQTIPLVALSTTRVLSGNLSVSCGTGVSHVVFGSGDRTSINITARYQAAIGFPDELSSTRLT